MARRSVLTPWSLWFDFALKSSEMLLASGQVIGERVDRMAKAGANPSASDRKEFMLMGTEKLKAGTDAWMAMSLKMWKPWIGNSAATARLASAGLAPIHRAATGNARRLARVKRNSGAARR